MKKKTTIKLSLLLLLFVFSNAIYAQTDTLSIEDMFNMNLEELMNLDVVSSSKSAEKVSVAPNVITVFGSDYLKTFGWNSLNDVLYKHPGFFPSQDYDRRTVGYRGNFEGWNNNHLLLMVDGVPFNDNLYGTAYTWDITPLIFTKSLEVIRGPGAALYGNNATNGVLTMNTISYNDFGDKNVLLSAKYGEKNTQIYDVVTRFKTNLFKNVTSISFNKTDGEEYMSYDAETSPNNAFNQKFETKDNHHGGYVFTKFEGDGALEGLSLQYHFQLWDYETGHGWLFEIPDNQETMQEHRSLTVLKYKNDINDKISHEYVLRHQYHAIDWDMFYYRNAAFGNFYPNSVNEYLKTGVHDVFARAQYSFNLTKEVKILAAIEYTSLLYNGDKKHYSNTDLNDLGGFTMDDGTVINTGEGWYAPFPNNEKREMEPWLEYIDGKPVNNIASFIQFSSGNVLGEKIKVTAGLRYDSEFFNYTDINDNNIEKSKNFNEISPRLVIVFIPTEKFTIKLIGGNGFRAPTPTELFGSNTWTLASNLDELEPERIQTTELALDYQINDNLVVRMNGFYNKSEGQIAYSLGNFNLSTNIYNLTNVGTEAEITYTSKSFLVFANTSYTQRIDEEIYEAEQDWISVHEDRITWAPSLTANFGLSYLFNKFSVSALGHYQGEVKRRDLDIYTTNEITDMGLTETPRPDVIDSWFSVDAKVSYKIKSFEFGLSATNLLDTNNYLAKNLKYPFDYKMQGRRIMFNTLISF